MRGGNPYDFATRKHRGTDARRGNGTLPMAPDLTGGDRRAREIENLERVQESRPRKPPGWSCCGCKAVREPRDGFGRFGFSSPCTLCGWPVKVQP